MAESTLIALVFDDEQEAKRLWQRHQELQITGLVPSDDAVSIGDFYIAIDNAAMVICQQDGQVIVQQVVSPAGEDAINAQTWEHIIKTLLSGWSGGIDDWFIQQIKQHLLPGTSAFFLLVDQSRSQDVLLALRGYSGHLYYSSLLTEDKARIRAAAGQA